MSEPWAFFCPAERKPLARERLKELGYEVSIDIPHAIPDNSSWVCKHVCKPGVYWEVSPTVTQSHSMPKKIFHLEDLWGDFPRAEKAIKACEHCGYAIRWTSSTTYCSRNCSDEAFRIRGNRCPTCGRMKTLETCIILQVSEDKMLPHDYKWWSFDYRKRSFMPPRQ